MAAPIRVDDPERAEACSMLVGADAPRYAELGMREQTFARMLFYTLWEELFHWESQNATSPGSPTGRRYLDGASYGSKLLIFTRDTEDDETGLTVPYTCLGQVDYVQHSGEKPLLSGGSCTGRCRPMHTRRPLPSHNNGFPTTRLVL